MKETFIVQQKIGLSELLKVAFFQGSRIKIIRRMFIFSFIIGFINGASEIFVPSQREFIWYMVIVKTLLFPFFLAAFFLVLFSLGSILLMYFKPNHFNRVTYRFTNRGIEKNGIEMNFFVPWMDVNKILESKDFIFFYVTAYDAHFVQKRMFEDEKELQDFRTFVSAQIG